MELQETNMASHGKKVRVKSVSLSVLGFGGGVGWEISDAEQKAVQGLIAYLEDRRILFNTPDQQMREKADPSVDDIRSECTDVIGKLDSKSPAEAAVRGIRRACHQFLSEIGGPGRNEADFYLALGELRGAVGLHVAALSQAYNVGVEDQLARILPKDD
ncbi:hypothetical protein XI01_16405 [Bradyrhizobium sp. CCBAU 21360]|nr:hypothetical protein [Bradyrhizobium sp. CCBAU 21360]